MTDGRDNNQQIGVMNRIRDALQRARAKLEQEERDRRMPIAIVGTGCRLPGGANSPEDFWQLLLDRVDATCEIPAGRWDRSAYFDPTPGRPGKMYIERGGFIEHVDRFDAEFFGISAREATVMDPQHRLLLETCWEALERAGIAPLGLKNSKTGVYIGIIQNDYGRLTLDAERPRAIDAYSGTGNMFSFAPGRVAFSLGLQGPVMAIDTACSSSLVALHLACSALRAGEADLALAGGVHLFLSPQVGVFLSKTGVLAPDGRAKTFDAAADGFSRGEGSCVFVLKRLPDALSAGDSIMALIRSSSVNHDGPSSGLTAPNEFAQERLIREALASADLSPQDIDYIEAHGTGTSLGDPIELNALASVFCEHRSTSSPLRVGAVKTNIGHLEATAGAAGVLKTALALHHETLPGQLHFNEPNPLFPWSKHALRIVEHAEPWRISDRPRLAGVSSFGMNGTNGHVILEEYRPESAAKHVARMAVIELSTAATVGDRVLPLSAKSEAALRSLAASYRDFLVRNPDISLNSVCHTAAIGRSHFDIRLGVVAATIQQLKNRLDEYCHQRATTGVYAGRIVDKGVVSGERAPVPAGAHQIAQAYVQGMPVEWPTLHGEFRPPKITLPTYPFQRRSFWAKVEDAREPREEALLGQLVRVPFSDEIRFETVFSRTRMPHLEDHQIQGTVLVAAASYLALVITAIGRVSTRTSCLLEDVRFQRMLVLAPDDECTVQTILRPTGNGRYSFHVVSCRQDATESELLNDGSWTVHATGTVSSMQRPSNVKDPRIIDADTRTLWQHGRKTTGREFYAEASARGYDFGATFQHGREYCTDGQNLVGTLCVPDDVTPIPACDIHPGLLDACLHPLLLLLEPTSETSFLPVRLSRLEFNGPVPHQGTLLYSAGIESPQSTTGTQSSAASLQLTDEHGSIRYIDASGFTLRSVQTDAFAGTEPGVTGALYVVDWQPCKSQTSYRSGSRNATGPANMQSSRRWLLLCDAGGVGASVGRDLERAGDTCFYHWRDKVSSDVAEPVPWPEENDYAQLMPGHDAFDGVVFLWGLDVQDIEESSALTASVFQLVRALVNAGFDSELYLITRGACAVDSGELVPGLPGAPLWGAARTIRLEHPTTRCTVIDLESNGPGEESDTHGLTDILSLAGDESQFALRGRRRLVPRLVQSPTQTSRPQVRSDRTYLITGGLGALGRCTASWLVAAGARHLVLTHRQPRTQHVLDRAIRELQQDGANILTLESDASVPDQVSRLFSTLEQTMPPLAGIIHTAGILDDSIVIHQTLAATQRVFAPKVNGAWLLHRHTASMPLDFFVLFSSTASLFGSKGQANYSAANAFLDALVQYRRALGLPGTSICWGPWAEIGMAARIAQRTDWSRLAFSPLSAKRGIKLLQQSFVVNRAIVGAVAVEWANFQSRFLGNVAVPFFHNTVTTPSITEIRMQSSRSVTLDVSRTIAALQAAAPGERRDVLTEYVALRIGSMLDPQNPRTIDHRAGLFEVGVDSLLSIELKAAFEEDLQLPLRQTLLFDFPTIESMVGYLLEELSGILDTVSEETLKPADSTSTPVTLPGHVAAAGLVSNELASTDQHIHQTERLPHIFRAIPEGTETCEPIAVVGIGCRFPGSVDTPDTFWQLLTEGRDAIVDMPYRRWDLDAMYSSNPGEPGKMYVRQGGFLDSVSQFDAQFFGVTPREAVGMDPQQRLLLELAWEALENANIAADRLYGSSTGVFVGIGTFDYALRRVRAQRPEQIDAYFMSGSSLSVAAGRLAYTLGLTGPCLSVDTACSSSLVGLHLACQSLRAGECDNALAGGVGLLLALEPYVNFCKAKMLSPGSRCKTFDASADGYVRGEGGGVVVLRRLSDARRDNQRILALIRGSAVNQDGHSGGLTVPNGPAQERVIRDALDMSGIQPNDVGFIESHGTGTSLGDPIEMASLGNVFCATERMQPLWVGAVKTNIGHLESAAGIAGFIKAVLALQHAEIPANLHFNNPSPHIDWDRLAVAIPTSQERFPAIGGRRIAGVSSFGFSGTNAHVIIESAPEGYAERDVAVHPQLSRTERPRHVLSMSAKSAPALQELASRYVATLEGAREQDIANICHVANHGRSDFDHRIALPMDDAGNAARALTAFAAGRPAEAVHHAVTNTRSKIGFLFSGQGSQYVAMGRQLYETQSTYRALIDRCDAVFVEETGTGLLDVLFAVDGSDNQSLIHQTAYTQSALYSIQCALVAMWRSWGIEPNAVLGHSVGEYAAAWTSGVFELEDGLRLLITRGKLMQALPAGGSMMAVFSDEATVHEFVGGHEDRVSVAAINGPRMTVISGEEYSIRQIATELLNQGIRTVPLRVSHAFHSPLMEPMLDALGRVVQMTPLKAPRVRFVSTLTGETETDRVTESTYWVRQAREPVRFMKSLQSLCDDVGVTSFLEIGPRPVLLSLGRRFLDSAGTVWLPSISPDQEDWQTLTDSLAALYTAGATIDWLSFDRDFQRRPVLLPTYPFQRQHHWIDEEPEAVDPGDDEVRDSAHRAHPERLEVVDLPFSNESRFAMSYAATTPGFINDHQLFGTHVVAGAAHLSMTIEAVERLVGGESPLTLSQVRFLEAAIVPGERVLDVQIIVGTDQVRQQTVRVVSALQADSSTEQSWHEHVTARLEQHVAADTRSLSTFDRGAFQTRARTMAGSELYAQIASSGHHLGRSFQWVSSIWSTDDEYLCRMRRPALAGTTMKRYRIPPGLIDSCIQYLCVHGPHMGCDRTKKPDAPIESVEEYIYVPFSIERFAVHYSIAEVDELWCRGRLSGNSGTSAYLEADIWLTDESGRIVVEIEGFVARRLHLKDLQLSTPERISTTTYEVQWSQSDWRPANQSNGRIFCVVGTDEIGISWVLQTRGHTCVSAEDVFAEAGSEALGVSDLLCMWNDASVADSLSACVRLIELVQRGEHSSRLHEPRLWSVTRTAQYVKSGDSVAGFAHGSLWGLCRVIAREHPSYQCRSIDLGHTVYEQDLRQLADLLCDSATPDEIALRAGIFFTPQIHALTSPAVAKNDHDRIGDIPSPQAVCLITGGLGALGMRVAEWLVGREWKHLILVDRRAPGDDVKRLLQRLRERGTSVTVAQVDVTEHAQLATALREHVDSVGLELRGVIHAAGVLSDRVLLREDQAHFDTVFAPKVLGAWNLHELTRARNLDFFVMFSSAAALLGSVGQGSYAAANSFLDSMACFRRASGQCALSIAWGPWKDSGMAASLGPIELSRLYRSGLTPLPPQEALNALGQSLQRNASHLVPIAIDWTKFVRDANHASVPIRFHRLGGSIKDLAKQRDSATTNLLERIASSGLSRRRDMLLEHVATTVAATIGLEQSSRIDVEQGLFDLGVDSLMALEIKDRLSAACGRAIRSTLVFDFPTIAQLTDYLLDELSDIESTAERSTNSEVASVRANHASTPVLVSSSSVEPIAIVGIGCRFPGDVAHPDAFWELLECGRDTISDAPSERLDMDAYFDPNPGVPGKSYTRYGGFLRDIDQFDAQFFGVSPREAVNLDPQQRILLEVSWEALERAGLATATLRHSKTGVFVGISTCDYGALQVAANDTQLLNAYYSTGNNLCMAAGRISYSLGLTGPSIAIDTACSSSLVSVHLACQSLRTRECDAALAGGVGLILRPDLFIGFSQARMLSPDGRCKAFDSTANGYGRGEGCGVVVLERLSDAIARGHTITAVIRGSAINQDGPSAGFTVPNGPSQQAVIRAALEQADIPAYDVGYVEAHGTGTALGDPIEIGALGTVFREKGPGQPLLVGSIKTNLGHLEAAAGIAGLIKAALCVAHERIPASLHCNRPNPKIPWKDVPVEVVTDTRRWPEGRRIAGVSSFGASGTNAHVVLSALAEVDAMASRVAMEPVADSARVAHNSRSWVLPLSARAPTALRALVDRYLDLLERDSKVPLSSLCCAASTRRAHFEYRLAIVAASISQLRTRLEGYAAGRFPEGVLYGDADSWSDVTSSSTERIRDPYELANSYVCGHKIDWRAYFDGYLAEDIELPCYPFQRERYWLDQSSTYALISKTVVEDETHIALPSNHAYLGPRLEIPGASSEYFQKRIGVTSSPLLTDHRFLDAALFPLVGFLEMVLGATQDKIAGAVTITDLRVHQGLFLSDEFDASVELSLEIAQKQERFITRIYSRDVTDDDSPWQLHVACVVAGATGGENIAAIAARPITADKGLEYSGADCYQRFRARGFRMGPAFRTIQRAWISDGQCVSRVLVPKSAWTGGWRHRLHPILLDACLQTAGLIIPDGVYTPVAIGQLVAHPAGLIPADGAWREELWVQARLHENTNESEHLVADVQLFDEDGALWVELENLRFARGKRGDTEGQQARIYHDSVYELVWRKCSLQEDTQDIQHRRKEPRRWVLLSDSSAMEDGIRTALVEGAETLICVRHGDKFARLDDCVFVMNPRNPDDYRLLMSALDSLDSQRPYVLLYAHGATITLADFEASIVGPTQERFAAEMGLLYLAQSLSRTTFQYKPRLWVITRGAQAIENRQIEVHQSSLWGIGASIADELPAYRCTLIDLEPSAPMEDMTALVREVRADTKQTRIAWRKTGRYTPRLTLWNCPIQSNSIIMSPEHTYMVTGGLGALGQQVTQWLAEHGARHIALLGRNRPSVEARSSLARLQGQGVSVLTYEVDVSDRARLAEVMGEIRVSSPPLAGIVHAAGVLNDAILEHQSHERVHEVMAPKAIGGYHLHALTADMNLDWFVTFSSVAGLLSGRGQANYAAANSFLDGLAHYRRNSGRAAQTINWGPWSSVGMAEQLSDKERAFVERRGFRGLSPDDALAALEAVLVSNVVQVAVVAVEWSLYFAQESGSEMIGLANELRGSRRTSEPSSTSDQKADIDAVSANSLILTLTQTPAAQRPALVSQFVKSEIRAVLGLRDTVVIHMRTPLIELGVDSLMAIELKDRIESSLGESLVATLIFDHPTVESLVRYLLDEVLSGHWNASSTKSDGVEDDLDELSEDELASLLEQELIMLGQTRNDS